MSFRLARMKGRTPLGRAQPKDRSLATRRPSRRRKRLASQTVMKTMTTDRLSLR